MKRLVIAGGVALLLFAALVVASVMMPESPERLPYSVANARPAGTRALGQVLAANGVKVTQVTTLADALAAPAGATLAVVVNEELTPAAIGQLSRTAADVVVVYTGSEESYTVEALSDHQVETTYWWLDADNAPLDCTDPDALAAGSITEDPLWALDSLNVTNTACFTDEYDASLYVDLITDVHRVTIVAGRTWLQNGTIAQEGNAALALRVFGRHDQLIWYLPGADAKTAATSEDAQFDSFSLLPPWSRPVFAILLAAAAAAALWRGRRFGALVKEQMPVELPASEASAGLAGLYRQSGARGHAAAALRAASIKRTAARLGLATSAPPETVVTRLADASSIDPGVLSNLLYGPPPITDQDLADLATTLTDLDRKLSSR
ncbi:MAG: DUF4350 domain-containing protein [Propionicimonas sp.]|uniref:DUF4350 domain-containing protein n=1 Tax=Propionicimonas sp. TaxID=1955623 RepID=UPI0025E9F826|nr:DUF4350 domain-containing protein [Propionicimonas sp.]MBU4188432.1 DUF4350 domain-containing protein [Actinomycetota bacterium]MBU4206550.1 DUF4350 domain-containing protein [Actinomycetota bacterium]MBU4411280.1 DUF4350 domain-containing protein [Actinomycetota bacterium]MBU4587522.1 DUF4350 domain-containing protein [Actinomycetota bacterium]MCG2805053.1 DUF4350 domain-containing protein [Propionicimonas sp.]